MSDKYEAVQELGSGAFGTAWLMSEKSSGRQVVAKVIKMKSLSKTELDRCITEVAILSACNHANIVRYIEAFVSKKSLHIVMEYAKEGDLHQRLRDQQGTPLERKIVLDWFVQIVLALDYIHTRSILHRDLKPHNVFVMEDNTLKLGDFGIAKVLCSKRDFASTMIGTPYYISPEICQCKQYNSSSDMWAAGCLLYQMCHLQVPFDAPTLTELYQKIGQCQYKPIPSHYGLTIPYLVSQLLVVTADNRLTAKAILSLPELSLLAAMLTHKQAGYKSSRSTSKLNERSEQVTGEQVDQDDTKNKPIHSVEVEKTIPLTHEPVVNDGVAKSEDRSTLEKHKQILTEKEKLGSPGSADSKQRNNPYFLSHSPRTIEALNEDFGRKSSADYTGRMSHGRCLSDRSQQPACKKSRTYTVKECIKRRLSEASPKLSTTIAKQRFDLSVANPTALHQVNQRDAVVSGRDWEMEDEVIDDVFSPNIKATGGASNIVNTRTYVVGRKDTVDLNNNENSSGQDVTAIMVEALSVSGFNREMARSILFNGLVCHVGHDRSTALIDKVSNTIVQHGQSYQTLQTMLNIDELKLIPLIAMLCW